MIYPILPLPAQAVVVVANPAAREPFSREQLFASGEFSILDLVEGTSMAKTDKKYKKDKKREDKLKKKTEKKARKGAIGVVGMNSGTSQDLANGSTPPSSPNNKGKHAQRNKTVGVGLELVDTHSAIPRLPAEKAPAPESSSSSPTVRRRAVAVACEDD